VKTKTIKLHADRNNLQNSSSDKNLEQWINFKFCVKIGKSASETSALLTLDFGEYAMKKLSL
jgi:hypothetical protein